MVQAVILAAGKAVRMRPLTLKKHKVLLEVNGKPLLLYHLENLLGLAEEVILVVGHLKEQIIDFVENLEKTDKRFEKMKFTFVEQKEQLGTGHAVLQVEKHIKGRFILLMGDDMYSRVDIENLLKHENAVLVQEVENPEEFGICTVKDNLFVDIIEKPKEPISNLANAAAYVFGVEIFEFIKNLKKSERGELELTDAIKELAKKQPVFCEKVKGFWLPIAYPEDLEKAEKHLKGQK